MSYKAKRVSKIDDNLTGEQNDGVKNFIHRLSKQMRGVDFHYRSKNSSWVFMEGQPYCMGWIAFGDYRDTGKGIENYVVYSHNIRNMKYSAYNRDQHYMTMSLHLKDGVKNAKRYLKNFTMFDIANETLSNVKHRFTSARYKVRQDADDKKDKMFTSISMYREMEHLVHTGYAFLDSAFGQQVKDYITSQQEKKVSDAKHLNLHLIKVYEKLGEQHFDVVQINDASKVYKLRPDEFPPELMNTYTDVTLPQELAGKLSVVNILAQDQYVEDVGYALGDGMYYVSV
jgi:hypothetical protein